MALRLEFKSKAVNIELIGPINEVFRLKNIDHRLFETALTRVQKVFSWKRSDRIAWLFLWPDGEVLKAEGEKYGIAIVRTQEGEITFELLGQTPSKRLSLIHDKPISGDDLRSGIGKVGALSPFVRRNGNEYSTQSGTTKSAHMIRSYEWNDVPPTELAPADEETHEDLATVRDERDKAQRELDERSRELETANRHRIRLHRNYIGSLSVAALFALAALWLALSLSPTPTSTPILPPSELSDALSGWAQNTLLRGLPKYTPEDIHLIVDEIERLPRCKPNNLREGEAVFDYRIHGPFSSDLLKLTYFKLGISSDIQTCAGHRDPLDSSMICVQRTEKTWERCISSETDDGKQRESWDCSGRGKPLQDVACIARYPDESRGSRDSDSWVFSLGISQGAQYDVVLASPVGYDKGIQTTNAHLLLQLNTAKPTRLPIELLRTEHDASHSVRMVEKSYDKDGERERNFLEAMAALCEPMRAAPYSEILAAYGWKQPLDKLCDEPKNSMVEDFLKRPWYGPKEDLAPPQGFVGDYLVIIDRGSLPKARNPPESAVGSGVPPAKAPPEP